jgi:hypothetical protein
MDSQLTVSELESRWENTLTATGTAVARHPRTYRTLKALAVEVVERPIDINDYFPTVEKLLKHFELLDPCGTGSIFEIFKFRIKPSSIWQVKMLRVECRDLLNHLNTFDEWRRKKHHLQVVK